MHTFVPQEGPENIFPHSHQECSEGAAASLRNLEVAPLQAREDGRRDHCLAELINVHGDDRVPK